MKSPSCRRCQSRASALAPTWCVLREDLNVKKFLTLLLTLCLLLGAMAVPASAATVVAVNTKYADATKSPTGTSPMYGAYSLFTNIDGAWMEWPITIPADGTYKLTLTWTGGNYSFLTNYPQLFMDGVCLWSGVVTDTTAKPFPGPDGQSDGEDMVSVLGTCDLPAGAHTVRARNGKGYWYINKIQFELLEETTEDIVIHPEGYAEGSETGLTPTFYPESGTALEMAADSSFTSKIYVPTAGEYGISLSYINKGEGDAAVTATVGDCTLEAALPQDGKTEFQNGYFIGKMNLASGYNELTVSATGATVEIDTMALVTLDNLAVENVAANDFYLTSGDAVSRGTDAFTVTYTTPVQAATVNAETVSIAAEDGDSIAAKLVTEGKNIRIQLLETLDYGTDYTLTVNGIKDVFDRTPEVLTFPFTTGGQDGDEGDGTVTVTEHSLTDNTVSVSGTVLSSVGLPIAGRAVKATVTLPDGTESYDTEAVLSDAEGSFSLSFDLDTMGDSGEYNFVISNEYAEATPFTHLFVAEGTKNIVINSFKNAGTADDVQDIFEAYDYAMGVSYPEDLAVLEDGDEALFFNHFVHLNADSIETIRNTYDYWLLFETLNQADSQDTVSAILTSDSDCEALGLDKERIDRITEYANEFYAVVAALEAQVSEAEYASAFGEVLNAYLSTELGKEEVALSASDAQGYPGQGIKLAYAFAEELDDVVGMMISFSTDSDKLNLKNAKFSIEPEMEYSLETEEDAAVVMLESDAAQTVTDVVTLTVVVPSAIGTHDIVTEGVVTYLCDGVEFTVEIPEETACLRSVEAPKSTGGRGSGGSRTTGLAGGTAGTLVQVEKTEIPDTPGQNVEEVPYAFTDLANVLWAQKSIESLLAKNIISQSEDKCFYPDRNVTREEYVKMLVMALDIYDAEAAASFGDVDAGAWYAPYIASAEKAGLVTGDEQGKFGIGASISRQDMAVMTYRALLQKNAELSQGNEVFSDDADIAEYAKKAVYALKESGILNGTGDNQFTPAGTATRAMAAKVIDGMLEGLGA